MGFVKERSVATNMAGFLQKIFQALDDNSTEQIVALYTDFSKASDKVPYFGLMKKVADIGIGGCLLELLANYLVIPAIFCDISHHLFQVASL